MIREEGTPLHELVTKLMDALPMFGRKLVPLLLNPKAAVLEQDLESDSALQQALTFAAVSFGIAFIAQIPFLPKEGDKEVLFGVLAVQAALSFALNVALAILAWKIVGGKLAWKKVVVATCYFSSVSTLLFLAIYLVAAGAFKLLDPDGFQQFITGTVADSAALVHGAGFLAFFALIILAFIVCYIWIFIVWGAYRDILQLSRRRSAIALALFLAFTPFLFTVQILLGATLFLLQTGPAVPPELVGQWQRIQKTEPPGIPSGIPSIDILTYNFAPPEHRWLPLGSYFINNLHSSAESGCLLQTLRIEFGTLFVHGSKLTLIPARRALSRKNNCTGQRTDTQMERTRTDFQFKIDQQPTGWTLCLNDRFGPTCLTPEKPRTP